MQSSPLELRMHILKTSLNMPAQTSSACSYSSLYETQCGVTQKKDAPLISGFQHVIFLIWLKECIHVITIISCPHDVYRRKLAMVSSCRKSWVRGVLVRKRGLRRRETVGGPSEKVIFAPCVSLQRVWLISSLCSLRGILMQTSFNICIMWA